MSHGVKSSRIKALSHGVIFLFATAMQKMDCVDVNEGCSYGAISCACDGLVCATSHTIRLHTHSLRL